MQHLHCSQLLWLKIPLLALLLATPVHADDPVASDHLVLVTEVLADNQDPTVRLNLLRGLLRGLEGRRNVTPPPRWHQLSEALELSHHAEIRDLTQQLSQIFGDPQALQAALKVLQNEDEPTSSRRSALQSLLRQRSEAASDSLEPLLDHPELSLDAIRGYAMVENPAAPAILLERYPSMAADQQQAVIETLATRRRYAQVLVAALREKTINPDAIPIHVARSLTALLGDQFTSVYGQVRELNQDREQLMEHYRQLITPESIVTADASQGRAVFQKTCAACHQMYGEGGTIGPDLTGSNRANLDYILLNSVDPSYDVPEGYQMVQILTSDDRVINGVIAEEDDTRIVLKTVEQPTLIVAKADIVTRRVSPKSMMPDGQLEAMQPQEIFALIKYLRTSEQVDMKPVEITP